MNPPPDDTVAIPPVVRTVLYYLIAEAMIVCTAVVGGASDWNLALQIASGNSILFFGTAAAKVQAKKADTDHGGVWGGGADDVAGEVF